MEVVWENDSITKDLGTRSMTHCAYNVVGLPISAMDFVSLALISSNIESGKENEFKFTSDPLHIRSLDFVSSEQCNIGGCVDNANKTRLEIVSNNEIKLFIKHQKMGSGIYYKFEFTAEAKENRRLLAEKDDANLRRLAWVKGTIYATLTLNDELTRGEEDATETTLQEEEGSVVFVQGEG